MTMVIGAASRLVAFCLLLHDWNANGFSFPGHAVQPQAEPINARRSFIAAASSMVGAAVLFPQKSSAIEAGGKIVYGDEQIMSQKVRKLLRAASCLLFPGHEPLAPMLGAFNR